MARVVIVILVLAVTFAAIHRLRRHDYLSVTPSTFPACGQGDIVVHVKWDMRGTASGHYVLLEGRQLGLLPRIFAPGTLAGEIDTGRWVNDGTTIIVTDEKGRVLAMRTIESTECPAAPASTHAL
jgi:hypothetical protein